MDIDLKSESVGCHLSKKIYILLAVMSNRLFVPMYNPLIVMLSLFLYFSALNFLIILS